MPIAEVAEDQEAKISGVARAADEEIIGAVDQSDEPGGGGKGMREHV